MYLRTYVSCISVISDADYKRYSLSRGPMWGNSIRNIHLRPHTSNSHHGCGLKSMKQISKFKLLLLCWTLSIVAFTEPTAFTRTISIAIALPSQWQTATPRILASTTSPMGLQAPQSGRVPNVSHALRIRSSFWQNSPSRTRSKQFQRRYPLSFANPP